jgi:L-serine/L-threonine ammonia-lyase
MVIQRDAVGEQIGGTKGEVPTTAKSMTAALLLVIALAFVESFVVVPSIAAAISRQREQSKVLKNVVVMSTTSSSSSYSSSCDDVAHEARALKLFSNTPLIYSAPLSKLCQSHPVYLKLDCLQRSGSFKDRGMAHLCASVYKAHTTDTNTAAAAAAANHNNDNNDVSSSSSTRLKLISSSGGNAGLAITTVASLMPKQHNIDVSVIVPQTTKPLVITKLQSLGAKVTIHGTNWNIADALARQLVNESSSNGNGGNAVYVSPYDNHFLWTGHSTVIDEIIHQLLLEFDNSSSSSSPSQHGKIGAILASVGGGGLLCGILEGIERNIDGGSSVDDKSKNIIRGCKVVACETEGAASFAASFNASSSSSSSSSTTTVTRGGKKEVTMVRLNGITSIATSLGALEVTPEVIQRAHRHQERANGEGGSGEDVLSYVCTDSEAVDACIQFAADHRILVEPACGAALAPLYSERLRVKLLDELRHNKDSFIVVEVCGGSGVNLELLEGWKTQFL